MGIPEIIFIVHAYHGDENGVLSEKRIIQDAIFSDVAKAKNFAGRVAKRVNGPVDLAYSGDEPWEERYITTASPSEFHVSGFRFERLV